MQKKGREREDGTVIVGKYQSPILHILLKMTI
jgi:hypothetical protein